jgi:hypothetical protein
MELKLNETLQNHLAEYDQTLARTKAAAEQQERTQRLRASRAQTWALGRIKPMIPKAIVSEEAQNLAIKDINMDTVEERIRSWRDKDNKLIAFIAHFESIWYAWWLSPTPDYIYGVAVTIKNTAATLQKIINNAPQGRMYLSTGRPRSEELVMYVPGDWPIKGVHQNDLVEYKVGRCKFLTWNQCIRTEHIERGFAAGWSHPLTYNGLSNSKGQRFRNIHTEAQGLLKTKVIRWVDRNTGTFTRLRNNYNTIWYCMHQQSLRGNTTGNATIFRESDVSFDQFSHTSEFYIDLFLYKHELMCQTDEQRQFYNRPAFKSLLQKAIDESSKAFAKAQTDDQDCWNTYLIAQPIYKVYYWLQWVHQIYRIWPDCPVDYYYNNFDMLQYIEVINLVSRPNITKQWLRENMPVASFFTLLKNTSTRMLDAVGKPEMSNYNRYDFTTCNVRRYQIIKIRDLSDTLSMIQSILIADKTLEKPKRWRLSEWHDHVQSESWKLTHKNQELPQDLFPQPFKLTVEGTKVCIMQPIDLHQLAQWGQAARNCVGTGGYSDKVKRKQEFILMIMLDNKPRFTAQLKLQAGILKVVQIKDVSNKTLNIEQKTLVEFCLGEALNALSESLTKDKPETENKEQLQLVGAES